ncbi:acetate/propionate family kinase [Flavobacteriaceae bacterium 14752]|uniref:acetate/propionate family kinase n=1 Tax=Mesohalobacter salilacus TaxID=2491711 RepID=UPI000F642539|nr:acetate kinase [Flavobacteriaceae bacterium 14752]
MNILVINSGSSSLKYQLIDMPNETVKASGLIERIGAENAKITYKKGDFKTSKELLIKNHEEALNQMNGFLMDEEFGVISNKDDIKIVGHRVVHGGKTFSDTVEITEEIKSKIESLCALAPLHNPPNLKGIEVSERVFSKAKQVAVFDTAFLQSLPQKAYQYAIPKSFLEDEDIRAYGFHGTSHKYVSEKAQEFLNSKNQPSSKLISIHLGNGCSMTAIKDGKAIDHSMGFGPANGLIMGTRAGDIDQSVIFYLIDKLGYSAEKVNTILLKESGMLGLTGSNDLRDIQQKAEAGNEDCQLALEMNAYRIKKYIGAYAVALNGLDAIIFTAGIGENSALMREIVCQDMDVLGLQIDDSKNQMSSNESRDISKTISDTKILVIPTNEELEIAKQAYKLH